MAANLSGGLDNMGPELSLNQIPFGQREADGALVDVFAVARGAKCGCRCPSCQTPLIARQGDEKVWHFAHASRRNYLHTVTVCEFSFYVSVRLMARQMIGADLTLALPEYRERVSRYVEPLKGTRECHYVVTEEGAVRLEQIVAETRFADVIVDLKGQVGDFEFVVYFSHPGRSVPSTLAALEGVRAGVLEIDLRSLAGRFARMAKHGVTYAQLLSNFLSGDRDSKRWIYHPRHAQIRADAETRLLAAIQRELEEANRLIPYECLFCGTVWEGHAAGLNACLSCRTHLGVRRLAS